MGNVGYNWGEPGLHPNLSLFVRTLRRRDISVGLSSNLNVFPDIKNVIREAPHYLRVSVSGYYNDVYRQTHRGGNVYAVKSNLYRLRELLDRYSNVDTVIQVGFHVYRSNFPRDFLRMRELCDELGFLFDPVLASFMPAEKTVALVNGHGDPEDRELLEKLVVPVERWMELFAGADGPTPIVSSDSTERPSTTTAALLYAAQCMMQTR